MRVGLAGLGWAFWRRKNDDSGFSRECKDCSVLVGSVFEGEDGNRGVRFGIEGKKERSAIG